MLTVGLTILVIAAFFGSLSVGAEPLELLTAARSIWYGETDIAGLILQEIRLPRALLGLSVGAVLGLSGAALQGLLRNPLAEPGIIGVSGSAALGAVIVFYSGLSSAFSLALPLGGITGAILAVLFLFVLAGRESSILTLILAGVAISSLSTALTSLALNLSPSPYAAMEIFFWMMGSLADRSMHHVLLALPLMITGCALILSCRSALDALSLGEETAQTLGVDVRGTTLKLIVGVALAVGSAVSVTGGIGFIGLVIPHIMRPLVGHQSGRLLVVSSLGGAALLLAADITVRLLPTNQELKLGIVTALIGAPFFFFLVLKTRRDKV
jgi:iron complex transport system permease protein